MQKKLTEKMGQRVAIWCMRYCYRGRIKEVLEDCVVIEDVYCVELAGESTDSKVKSEDFCPGDMVISFGTIEQFYQPNWV